MPLIKYFNKGEPGRDGIDGIDGISGGVQVPTIIKTVADANDYFMGIDSTGALYKITKSDLLAGLTSGTGAGIDPYFTNVVFLAHFNGANNSTSFVDIKGKTITRFGNPIISTTESKFDGSSVFFDGSGDYLEIANSADWAFGTADFCVEGYKNFSSVSSERGLIGKFETAAASTGWTFRLSTGNSPSGFRAVFGDGTSSLVLQKAWTPLINTWYHWAVARQSSIVKIFIDGIQLGTNDTVSLNLPTGSANLRIGNTQTVTGADFFGYMDDIRITKGNARYTANFTPPTAPFADS